MRFFFWSVVSVLASCVVDRVFESCSFQIKTFKKWYFLFLH